LILCITSLAAAQTAPRSDDVEKRVDSLLRSMTLKEKITLLGGTEGLNTSPLLRLGIPALRMSDGPVGVHDYGPTTAYPAGIALAASWDTDLARRVGESMGNDARARGVHFILGPGVNIYRTPQAGRNFEYLGEDPFLASRIVVPLIEGIQSRGVIATIKHFAGNNQEYDRQKLSSDIDERTLREIYLPAFEASVKEAKVGAIMDAYNLVNGTNMTANSHLNNEIAKQEWGFDGIIMSDWTATHDGIAAANGGLDLEMPSAVYMTPQTLIPAVRDGSVSMATIDDKVRRILRQAIQFGFLDRPQMDTSIPLYNEQSREVALEEARESMVLLKNENHVLPLNKRRIKTIAVIGPDAYPAVVGGGGSSNVTPFNAVSFLEGISGYLGDSVRVLSAADELTLDEIVNRTAFLTSQNGKKGLKAEYFDNLELQGNPALTRTDDKIDFDWGEGSYSGSGSADHFSVRWTGYFIPAVSAAYKFCLSPNDGARLYVDDKLVLDETDTHTKTLGIYGHDLQRQVPVKIRLEYFKNARTAAVRFGIVPAEQDPLIDSGGRTMGVRAKEAASQPQTWNLYVMDADGQNVRRLTDVAEHGICYFPTWTRDLIYFGYASGDGKQASIACVRPDGSGFRVIGPGRDPAISPDGQTIAFTQHTGRGYCLFAMNADGSAIRQLTAHENQIGAVTPAWSPDGQKLLYSDQVGKKLELFLCNFNGSNQKQLTYLEQFAASAAWSPDMRHITFRLTDYDYWNYPGSKEYVYREKKADKRPVWIMEADGSHPRVIEALHYHCALDGSRPVWKPARTTK